MNEQQQAFMAALKNWNIADAKQYVSGYGYRQACKLWEAVVSIACTLTKPEILAVWHYAAENYGDGFGKHDVTTAYNQSNVLLSGSRVS